MKARNSSWPSTAASLVPHASDAAESSIDLPRHRARRDLSASAVAAGLVAVLVSFGGTAVLMVQAGHTAGLDAARIGLGSAR